MTSAALQARRENLEGLRLETEELRIKHDFRKLQEEEQEVENRRKAEAQATALSRKEERERRRAQAAREADRRRQQAAEAEANRRRRQWEIGWKDYGLKLLPKDAPHSLELGVHQAISDALSNLDPDQPERIITRLVQAAVEKAQEPWKRRKEIEKVITETLRQLPARARGWPGRPSEWDARAMSAAADAIAQLGDTTAPLVKIEAVAIEAVGKIRVEYEEACKTEEHHQTCQCVVESRPLLLGLSATEREAAEHVVREAVGRLPVGTTRREMERTRDAALAPFQARAAAAQLADRYLNHVNTYIEELADEQSGKLDIGGFFERRELVQSLKAEFRPVLIRELLDEPMNEEEAREFVEEWIDSDLGLD